MTKIRKQLRKGRIPELKSGISKSESIGQLDVQRIGRSTFGECSENATDALPQDSRRRSCPSQSALVSH